MDEQWKLAKSVFRQAIELPAESREAFIRSQCSKESTCTRVLEMVETHFNDLDFLETPLAPEDSQVSFSMDPLIGRSFGNFVIQRRIGKGATGAVYEAMQSNPRRQVAIKVLRYDSQIDENVLRRFQNEADVLARLQHPNIAHVYESGTIREESGVQPWFAMELVDGLTLSSYLRQHNLTVHQKLELFLRICEAVEYAHRRGVIHRDLKPTNFLIKTNLTDDTRTPAEIAEPKIVDFGIARVTEADRNAPSMTPTKSIMGTLDYLSPEQVNNRSGLDHRCDIYSLGVVLFEMLTGQLPHDRGSGSLADVIQRIGSDRGRRLREIDNRLPKDLEMISGKALEPDPMQRYSSVQHLVDDLQRFLSKQPILARPPSLRYRVSKYIRRNRIMLGGMTTTILALIAGIITYAMIARQANQSAAEARYEAEKAVAVSSFITNDFVVSLLHSADKGTQSATRLVEIASEKIDTMYARQPLIEAAIRNEVGTIYYNISRFDLASEQYQIALELWQDLLGPEHPDTLKAVNNLAQAKVADSLGSDPETMVLSRRAYEGRLNVLGLEHPATLSSLSNLANLIANRETPEADAEAEALFVKGLTAIKQRPGGGEEGSKDFAVGLVIAGNLAKLYRRQGKLEEAINTHRELFESAQRVFGPGHHFSVTTGLIYAHSLYLAKELTEALNVLKPIMNDFDANAENDPESLIKPGRLLAKIYDRDGSFELAIARLELTFEAAIKSDPQHGILGNLKRDIDRVRKRMQRPEYAKQRDPAVEVRCRRLLSRIAEQRRAFDEALLELNRAGQLASKNGLDPELIKTINKDLDRLQEKIKLSTQ